MSWLLAYLPVLISFQVILSQTSYCCRLQFIAAYGDTDGELMSRSAATYGTTVRFSKIGQYVCWNFVARSSCNIDVLNVIHSNDGPSDNLAIYLNKKFIGGFQSVEHSNEGVFWNKMVESGLIGKTNILPQGNHTLCLNVSVVDIYGVEIDKIIIGVLCGAGRECLVTILGAPNDTQKLTSYSAGEDSHEWNRGSIISLSVGLTSTFVSVLFAIPSAIIAIWSIYKCINAKLPQRFEARVTKLNEPLIHPPSISDECLCNNHDFGLTRL